MVGLVSLTNIPLQNRLMMDVLPTHSYPKRVILSSSIIGDYINIIKSFTLSNVYEFKI